jgi:hypothetical protein
MTRQLNYFCLVTINNCFGMYLRMYENYLELRRSYFHLCFLHRSPVVFPMVPINPRGWSLTCLEVLTVEVGIVTAVMPPSTFVRCSTVTSPLIIVFVFGGELHSVVITQRITSSTLKYIVSTEVFILT